MAETEINNGKEEVEKVAAFLKSIGVKKDVLQTFQREKIDKDAVNAMEEKDLVELGLLAKGDRIKLKSFCKKGISSDREEKIARIKQILGQGKGKKRGDPTFSAAVGSTSSGKSARTSSLKYEVGWKHWKPGRGYVQMKKNAGGGTRTVHIPRNASLEECQTIAEGLFFPEGKSPVGELEKMITAMGNFSGDCIVLMREDGKPFQFSPERYKEMTGLTVPRLYLLTKNEDDADGDEDESFPSAFGYHDPSFGTKRASSPSFPKEDGLIGTSSERRQFFDDLDRELRASLAADKAKVKSTDKQQLIYEPTNDETDSLERLRQVREHRSPPEPNSSEPKVKVSVRHCTLGVVSRVFDPEGSMQGVYDWIGSLSKTPEHFLLVTFPSTTLYPDEKVVKVKDTVINMTETTEPVPLSKDEEDVYFQDGRGFEHGYDDTVLDENDFFSPQSPRQQGLPVIATHSTNEIDPVNINPPVHLLADEDNPKSDNKLSLEEKVQLQESKLQPAKIVIIDRHDAVNELLALYSDKDILDCKLSVSFADENALGDGVLREVYSVFWDSFVARFCEGSRQFAVIPNPSLSDENYEALGRIITHQLVLTGTFPIQLAEVQVLHALFGQVSDDLLVNSFLQILPERERQILSKAMDGKDPFPTNEIVDILSEFNASSVPSRSNLQKILKQVSLSELIHKPFFILSKMRQGMGNFWNDVAKDEIEELYRKASPDPKNVVSRLDFNVQDKKEEQVSGWLVRFLKGANPKLLGQFLRFCTGTDILLPGKRIQVRFESMSELAMRPKSKTCFCSLMLSKNYNSFTHFSSNLEFYLSNTSFWDLRD